MLFQYKIFRNSKQVTESNTPFYCEDSARQAGDRVVKQLCEHGPAERPLYEVMVIPVPDPAPVTFDPACLSLEQWLEFKDRQERFYSYPRMGHPHP